MGEPRTDGSIKSTLIHELGHALGLAHAHQDPSSRCLEEISFETVCTTPAPKSKIVDVGRKRAEFLRRMPRRLDPIPVWQFEYDPNSVMHYVFAPRILKAGTRSSCFARPGEPVRTLSPGDIARIGLLYPKDAAQQRNFLADQLEIFRRTLKALGVSKATGERLAALVTRQLARRHPDLAQPIDISNLDLPVAEQHDLEEALAHPVPPPLPAACALRTAVPAPGPQIPN
ncbi:MAG: hypothetical protein JSS20_18065 [Proteobacteria bacterium]|nr:hypothetical protein [Pseudomonadota bacterium]